MKKKTKESSPELHKTSFSWKNQDMKLKWLPAFFVAKISTNFLGVILLKQPKPMMRNVFPNLPIHKAGRRIYRSLEGGSPGADFALLMRYCFLMCKNWSEYDFKKNSLGLWKKFQVEFHKLIILQERLKFEGVCGWCFGPQWVVSFHWAHEAFIVDGWRSYMERLCLQTRHGNVPFRCGSWCPKDKLFCEDEFDLFRFMNHINEYQSYPFSFI